MKGFIKRVLGKAGADKQKRDKRLRGGGASGPAIAQVEVTTRCNLKCTMCPRTHYSGEKHLDFPWDVFEGFSGFFPKLELVYLQGWGEPMLHPRIFDMAALVREKGCQVGFTTNGSLLEKGAISEILRLPLQYVTVSVAGADAATHESIRAGSDYEALLGRVFHLVEAKKRAQQKYPLVHLSFLVTRESVSALPDMVRRAHEIGVDRLIAPNLDCPVTREEDDRRIFGFQEPERAFQEAVDEAQVIANRLGFRFNAYSLKLTDDVLTCELRPLRQFFVNVHGDVAPCTYSCLMGRSSFRRWFLGEAESVSPLIFGRLSEDDMETIWQSDEYRRFRRFYHNRIAACENVSYTHTSIHSVFGLTAYLREIDRALTQNPVPEFCRKCYKAYGA